MFIIEIARLKIAIHNRFSFVEEICKNYIVTSNSYDFEVSVTDEEIFQEKSLTNNKHTDGFIESVCIYRNIAKRLPDYDAFVFHCAAIEYDGYAYCFSAPSGTGKTTHIKLWRQTFGEKVLPINGDKPIFRFINNILYVCGTPWSGKEMFNRNVILPFGGICFLSQGKTNSIRLLENFEALNAIIPQAFICDEHQHTEKTINFIGKLINEKPIWHLSCNISSQAAIMAHDAMHIKE